MPKAATEGQRLQGSAQKKALKKGDYLQGSNANSLVRFGPAQGGEAGGEFITYPSEGGFPKKFDEIRYF